MSEDMNDKIRYRDEILSCVWDTKKFRWPLKSAHHGLQLDGLSCLNEVGGDDDLLLLIFASDGDLRDKGNLCLAPCRLKS